MLNNRLDEVNEAATLIVNSFEMMTPYEDEKIIVQRGLGEREFLKIELKMPDKDSSTTLVYYGDRRVFAGLNVLLEPTDNNWFRPGLWIDHFLNLDVVKRLKSRFYSPIDDSALFPADPE